MYNKKLTISLAYVFFSNHFFYCVYKYYKYVGKKSVIYANCVSYGRKETISFKLYNVFMAKKIGVILINALKIKISKYSLVFLKRLRNSPYF